MPLDIGIWRLGTPPEKIQFEKIESEQKLEDMLSSDLSILSPDLLLLGRQVLTAQGNTIDLMAMDSEGNISVIELKKGRTPRGAVAQLLDYASWVQSLSRDEIAEIYKGANDGQAIETGFAEKFPDDGFPEEINRALNLVLVAVELDSSSERIISFLANNYAVPINAVFFRYFKDGDNEYLTRTWFIDPQESEVSASRRGVTKSKEPWNRKDFYVNCAPPEHRNWKDSRKYKFISAGGEKWSIKSLKQLFVGARVFVYVPKHGYVGVGRVVEEAVSINDFYVRKDDDSKVLMREVPELYKRNCQPYPDDPDMCQHMVRVEWIKEVGLEDAYRMKGFYANQNSVTKFRNQFTLEHLIKHFELDDELDE